MRSTDPRALKSHRDPVGPENDTAILRECRRAGMVICAWGAHGKLRNRANTVRAMLGREGIDLYVLKMNGDGEPAHPLYLSYSLQPFRALGLAS